MCGKDAAKIFDVGDTFIADGLGTTRLLNDSPLILQKPCITHSTMIINSASCARFHIGQFFPGILHGLNVMFRKTRAFGLIKNMLTAMIAVGA